MIAAALETLERAGFACATARAIAATGGFNQALIYYHFESLEDLFAAALQAFSEGRLARYRAALAELRGLGPLIETMQRLYEEDLRAVTPAPPRRSSPAAIPPRSSANAWLS